MISTTKPSDLLIPLLSIAFAVFCFGGGLYDWIVKPLPAIYYNGQFLFLYPSLSDQFIGDTVVAITCFVLGIIGLLALYQSTKYVYKPRQAYMMLVIGIVLVLLSYILLQASMQFKLSGGTSY
jgi:membrane protein CcdC involved in cytochrome C biogenesis